MHIPIQTAANNAFLAKVKRVWNTDIFRATSRAMNADGHEAAVAYLQQYTTEPVESHMDAILARMEQFRKS